MIGSKPPSCGFSGEDSYMLWVLTEKLGEVKKKWKNKVRLEKKWTLGLVDGFPPYVFS